MDEETLPDFLGGEPVPGEHPVTSIDTTPEPQAEAAPAAEAPEAAASADGEGQLRGPDGKFAAATPQPEAAPADAVPLAQAAPAADPEADIAGKLAALLNERDKRQAVEAERDAALKRANELQAWRDEEEAKARRQPMPQPGTEGYEAARDAQFSEAMRAQNLRMSRTIAEVRHGVEVTSAAMDWGIKRCATDPHFNARLLASDDPVGMAVAEWRREDALAKIGNPANLEAFLKWQAEQAAAPAPGSETPTPQAQAALAAAPAAPRASIAAGPSAGRADVAEIGDVGDTFDAMFRR